MAQITIRGEEELLRRVKRCAAQSGKSMNEFVTAVLDAATDPDLAGDPADRVRERLRAAGLLAVIEPKHGARPSVAQVAAAGRRAARGRAVSEFVTDSR